MYHYPRLCYILRMKTRNTDLRDVKLWIFDADDTLWESGLYFRRAEEDFAALMHSLGFDPQELRDAIRRKDMERLSVSGYGVKPYLATLKLILGDKTKQITPYMVDCLDLISKSLLSHPLILLPDVRDSIGSMFTAGKRMVVYTMGEEKHQTDKFNRSGISQYFEHCTVVPLKTRDTIMELLSVTGVDPAEACIVGNSPRSDINPATGCGVNALYVKRPNPWLADQIEFAEPGLVKTIAGLREMLPFAGLTEADRHPLHRVR